MMPPLWGRKLVIHPSQGLTPLAIAYRRSAATRTADRFIEESAALIEISQNGPFSGTSHAPGRYDEPPSLPMSSLAVYNCAESFSNRPAIEKETVMPDITLAQAKTVVDAAFAKAQALGVKMNIAVVDTEPI